MIKHIVPLLIFLFLLVVLTVGLRLDKSVVPSPLIGKPVPHFSLPRLDALDMDFAPTDLLGQVWLLNVWASWCASCVVEHALLVELLAHEVPIVGLNYKDTPENAISWLQQHGDPYYVSLLDANGMVGLDWGVYGVPETFLIDKQGVIQYKYIGPLNELEIQKNLLPKLQHMQATIQ